jgi:hypothetical protein
MFSLLNGCLWLLTVLTSGLIDIRTSSGTISVDFVDGPVVLNVCTVDETAAEFEVSTGPKGVKISSGQHELLLPVEFKEVKVGDDQLQIVTNAGHQIQVTFKPDSANSDPQPPLNTHSDSNHKLLSELESVKVESSEPDVEGYESEKLFEAIMELSQLSPNASYADSETVILKIARNLPPSSIRSQKREALYLKATEQLLVTLIEQTRTNRSTSDERILLASQHDQALEDVVCVWVSPATLAVDVLRMIGADSPRLRSLIQDEMQTVLNLYPQPDGAYGLSGWKYSVVENMMSAGDGQLGLVAALASADKKAATVELTHLNTLLRTWEEFTGEAMVFRSSPTDSLAGLNGGLVIGHLDDAEKLRYLPQVTVYDHLSFDEWISRASQHSMSHTELEKLMMALKAGSEHLAYRQRCSDIRNDIIQRTFSELEPSEEWYRRIRCVLKPGLSEDEAQRLLNLIRDQPPETQEAFLKNVIARWRTINARSLALGQDGAAQAVLSTDFQFLESLLESVEHNQSGIEMAPEDGPLAKLLHDDIDRFEDFPKGYQDALMTVFRSRQGLWMAHKLLHEIAKDENHPRCLEASITLIRTGFSNDSLRDSIPPVVVKTVIDRSTQHEWLDAAGALGIVLANKFSEETALQLAALIVADTKTGDIRPLRIRIPQPLTTPYRVFSDDYIAESSAEVVISRRIMLAYTLATAVSESKKVRERVAVALAGAISPEVLNQVPAIREAELPEEFLFRISNDVFRVGSSTPDASNAIAGIEQDMANQAMEMAMSRLIQSPDWRTTLKHLQIEQQSQPTEDGTTN